MMAQPRNWQWEREWSLEHVVNRCDGGGGRGQPGDCAGF